MWSCFNQNMWPWGGGWAFSLIWGVIILVLILIAVKAFLSFRSNNNPRRDRKDSLAILKMRLARGEITEAEFWKMKEILEN